MKPVSQAIHEEIILNSHWNPVLKERQGVAEHESCAAGNEMSLTCETMQTNLLSSMSAWLYQCTITDLRIKM